MKKRIQQTTQSIRLYITNLSMQQIGEKQKLKLILKPKEEKRKKFSFLLKVCIQPVYINWWIIDFRKISFFFVIYFVNF